MNLPYLSPRYTNTAQLCLTELKTMFDSTNLRTGITHILNRPAGVFDSFKDVFATTEVRVLSLDTW